MSIKSLTPRLSSLAYTAAVLFTIHLLIYFIPSIRDVTVTRSPILAELMALLAIAEHLLLFPIIEALPAPRWAKSAGYGWLVVDIASDIMQLNGAVKLMYLTLRYGGHISSAFWTIAASWQATKGIKITGILYGIDLALYSFIAFIPLAFVVLIPSLILLPLWLVLIGKNLNHGSFSKAS